MILCYLSIPQYFPLFWWILLLLLAILCLVYGKRRWPSIQIYHISNCERVSSPTHRLLRANIWNVYGIFFCLLSKYNEPKHKYLPLTANVNKEMYNYYKRNSRYVQCYIHMFGLCKYMAINILKHLCRKYLTYYLNF